MSPSLSLVLSSRPVDLFYRPGVETAEYGEKRRLSRLVLSDTRWRNEILIRRPRRRSDRPVGRGARARIWRLTFNVKARLSSCQKSKAPRVNVVAEKKFRLKTYIYIQRCDRERERDGFLARESICESDTTAVPLTANSWAKQWINTDTLRRRTTRRNGSESSLFPLFSSLASEISF